MHWRTQGLSQGPCGDKINLGVASGPGYPLQVLIRW
jgi:hypothetical protein